jgi:hypothetical protein
MSPTRSRRLTRAAAGALAVTALAAPAASARPVDAPVGWKLTTPAQTHSQPATPAPTVIHTDDGFDWGAAGLGAGAGAAIVLLSLGGVRARRHGTVGA